jgi:hypothetical protein
MAGLRFARTLAVVLTISLPVCLNASTQNSQPASIPAPAQSSLSASMGADSPAYHVHANGGEFTFTNSAQRLETSFSSGAVELKNGDARWRLAFLGYGYGDKLSSAQAAAPSSKLNRVEYKRGMLTEWYVNGPAGLEQGFTIAQRPAGSQHGPLTIALSLSGDLTPVAANDGQSLSLNDRAGHEQLRYTGLLAYDNSGRALRSWLELQGKKLMLHVDDAGAQYPVVVDPTVELGTLSATDGASGAWLGYSIAISGTTIAIGAPQATIGSNSYQGAIYVYVEPKNGWTSFGQTAKLTASDGAADNYLGYSVSISGNTIVAGANNAEINGNPGQGAAYVFVEPTGGWANGNETAKLTASDGGLNDFFGYSVSISSGTIVVGEPHGTVNTNWDQGAAYVYVEPVAGWSDMTQTAKLTSNGSEGDQFGQAVSISGSNIAVGAPFVEVGGEFAQGAVYEFTEPAGGWANMTTPTAELTVASGPGYDYFGSSVATSGSVVVAGAPTANSDAGAAYVFVEPANGWANMTQTGTLTSSVGVAGDLLGNSVAISGTTIAVGAYHALIGSDTWGGATYLYVMPAAGWTTMTQSSRLVISHGNSYQEFGSGVSISGSVVAIGAYGFSSYTGAGYVFGPSTAKGIRVR